MENSIFIKTDVQDEGKRIDSFLSQKLEDMTRSAIQGIILSNNVVIDGKPVKKNYKICCGQTIKIILPDLKEVEILPQKMDINIVYEDDDIIVVNKDRGMVVHPAVGNWSGTLVNALMYHCAGRLSGINGQIRPGIVHRIDKDTSGLLVVAKNDFAHQNLCEQISKHEVLREYEAVLCGNIKEDKGVIDKPIARHKTERKKMCVCEDGKRAVTHYEIVQRYNGYVYAVFRLETGRTHQIRVHSAFIGHPIVGDIVYGFKKDRFSSVNGQCLNARKLSFLHPRTKKYVEFIVEQPQYFKDILKKVCSL